MRVRASTTSILQRPLLHSEQEPCIIFVRIIANCTVDSFTLECRARSRCCVSGCMQRGFKEEERSVYESEENGGGCGEYRTRANGCIIYCSHETQALYLPLFLISKIYYECFLMKFVAIVIASSEIYRNLQKKVLKSIFKSF